MQSIIDEATALSKKCSEIVLTGIDVSDFKIDGIPALKSLIQNLSHLTCRVRLSSFEPNVITTEFLQTAKNAPNFCPHFHLSLQSGCNSVLKQMNRHYTTEQFLQKVEQIRQFFPLAGITTDIIVGYPTETEKDFEQTLEFVERVGFSKVHYFAYSSRPGTRASKLGQLDGNVVKAREKKLATLSKKLAQNFLKANIGQPLEVLVEKSGEQSEGLSRNYIRCHINQNLPENSVVEVVGTKIFGDGLLCELKSKIFGRCGAIDAQDLKFALAKDVVVFLKSGKKIEGKCSQVSNEWQNSKLQRSKEQASFVIETNSGSKEIFLDEIDWFKVLNQNPPKPIDAQI